LEKFEERAFSNAGLAAWNSLPEHIHAEPDIRVFRKLLKTHLFLLTYTDILVFSMRLLECTYVEHVIGALQMLRRIRMRMRKTGSGELGGNVTDLSLIAACG